MSKKVFISGFSDEIASDFDVQMASVREFGVSYIELRGADGVNVSDFTPEKVREIKEKLKASNVRVSSIGSPIGKISVEDDFEAHLEKLSRTFDIMEELEAPYLRMFSFYIPSGSSPEAHREEVFSRMERMVDMARKRNLVMLHENEKGIYGDTGARCLELMKEFSCEWFRAVFDFANFIEVGQPTLPAYELLKPYIEYVHIKDAVSATKTVVPAGYGDGHVREILKDLTDSGYGGFLSLEPHLSNFSGLKDLELDPKERKEAMPPKEAWKCACDALCNILDELCVSR